MGNVGARFLKRKENVWNIKGDISASVLSILIVFV